MNCGTCGSTNPRGKRFCGECGSPLARACGACGAENPPGNKFCGDCGTLLNDAARAGATGTAVQPSGAPGEAATQAERRQLTVMFCDLVGSTALATRLDPEDLRNILDTYRRCVGDITARYHGSVAKYMGDGALIYFGYPLAHEDAAERAVRAALDIVENVPRLETGEGLHVRIGVATGLVVVGDLVGTDYGHERGVVGETPNLAARLQAIAAADAVVIAAGTRELLGALFECRELAPFEAKGFAEPVHAWQVLSLSAIESRFDAFHSEANLTHLVGREEEIDLLLRRWRQVRDAEGRVVLFTGEPGIGKTRIVRAFQQTLSEEAHTRLQYFCSTYHRTSALYPFISQLERAAGLRADDTTSIKLDRLEALLAGSSKNLAHDTSIIASLMSIPSDVRYPRREFSPQRRREETLIALLAQLEGLAAREPVLIIFEDAHWIDPTSMELLDRIVDVVQNLPVLLVVTARPEFVTTWAGRPHVTIHSLNRLGRRDATAMVERLTGGRVLPREIADQIIERTDGVPLFLEELTKTVLDSGLLADAGGRFELRGPLPPLAIPTTLHDSLMARLDRLASVKDVLQIGAIIGREFSYELLAAVVPLDDRRLREALSQAVASGLIFGRGVPPEATFSFKHALIQDTAYQSLLKASRQQYHLRIARVLEERFPRLAETQPEILAQHYSEAGQPEKAIDYWQQAGRLAAQRSANVEAVTHCERGLELLSVLPETRARDGRDLAIQMTIGPALVAARGFADQGVGRAYARAWELCRRLDDQPHLPIVLRGRQVFHRIRGELDKAREFSEQLLALAERRKDPALMVGSCQALGQDLFQMGELRSARKTVERGIALFDPAQHRVHNWPGGQPGEQCFLYSAFALWMLGYPERARRRSEEALALARSLANPANLINTLAFVALIHVFRRELAAAEQRAEATMALCTEQKNPYFLAWSRILRGWAWSASGRKDAGVAEIDQGLAAYRATGSQAWLPYFLGLQAETYLRATRHSDGLVVVSEALAVGETTGERCWQAELNRIKGELLLAASPENRASAEDCFSRSLDIARRQHARSWELRTATGLCRLWQGDGRNVDARALLAPVYGWFKEGDDTPDLMDAETLLGRQGRASAPPRAKSSL